MTSRPRTALLLLPLLLLGTPAPAADNFVLDPQPEHLRGIEDAPKWQEGSVTLPPWPRDADLIAFVPDGPQTPLRYFIDGKNIRVDKTSAVVHYTLVIESASGTRNVTAEGIRCTLKGAAKTYAYGSDGHFVPAPEADWQPIVEDTDTYRFDLHRFRFCVPRETRPKPLKDMLRALHGQGSAKDSTGFQTD